MKKEIQKQIEDELEDAKKYIICALKYKDTDRVWAEQYYSMAQQEYQHMNGLHKLVTDEIRRLADSGDESYNNMKSVYDYLHERIMEESNGVQIMMSNYKL